MPDYKQRRIELSARRHADATWHCQYRIIIEYRETGWGFRQGSSTGFFESSRDATAAALEEAKRIIDTLGRPARDTQLESKSALATYSNMIGRLLAWAR
jgi:hypothetical protein